MLPDIAEKRRSIAAITEEEVEHFVKLLEDAERSQKEVFLIVVQVYIKNIHFTHSSPLYCGI